MSSNNFQMGNCIFKDKQIIGENMNVLSFSGGKDSTCLLAIMIEKGIKIDRIINVDTTKEFPEMYEHIEKVKEYIKPYGLEIETISFDFDFLLHSHIKKRGKNKGKKGYGWPDFRNRWCTLYKTNAFKKEVYKTQEDKDIVIEFHGISFEEAETRGDKNQDGRNIERPLIDWKMTGKDCIQYCYDKGFDWGGLYETMGRVSCYCCPLSRIGELKQVYNNYPELWNKMKELDSKSYRRFRSDYSLKELEMKFDKEKI